MRIRAFPFSNEVRSFIAEHEKVFVLDQNRDGQLAGMLAMELGVAKSSLLSMLNYDGLPVTATWVETNLAKALDSKGGVKV